jgi:ABC-type nitrate/sulfonate/bicarbonate transport system substrate-binding protein
MKVIKSRPLASIVVAAALVIAAGVASADAARIRVHGSVPIWNVRGPVVVAQEKGFLAAAGITDVEFKLGGGTIESVRGLAAGGFDVLINAGTPSTLRAISLGAPIKIIGGFAHQARYSVFIKKGMTAADLKGKTIAVADLEDFTSRLLDIALKKLALDPMRDVRKIPAGPPGARMGAHFAGKVGASMNIYNLLPVYASRGFVPLINLHEIDELTPWSLIVVAANTKFLANNRDVARGFLSAIIRARTWYHDPKNAKELRAILGKSGMRFRSDRHFGFEYALDRAMTPDDLNLPRSHYENTERVMRSASALDKPVSYDDAVDSAILGEAQKAAQAN